MRDAALELIAERAEVSPALVVHHFGSRAGLREVGAGDVEMRTDEDAMRIYFLTLLSWAGVDLDEATVAALRAQLPRVASVVVAEVMQQVPAYDVPFQGRMGKIIERAVQVSLASFVGLASGTAPKTAPVGVGVAAARELGQAEAKRGRPIEALLSAYRVGASAAWRELSVEAVAAGQPRRAEAAMRTHMDSIRESLGSGLGEPGTTMG